MLEEPAAQASANGLGVDEKKVQLRFLRTVHVEAVEPQNPLTFLQQEDGIGIDVLRRNRKLVGAGGQEFRTVAPVALGSKGQAGKGFRVGSASRPDGTR